MVRTDSAISHFLVRLQRHPGVCERYDLVHRIHACRLAAIRDHVLARLGRWYDRLAFINLLVVHLKGLALYHHVCDRDGRNPPHDCVPVHSRVAKMALLEEPLQAMLPVTEACRDVEQGQGATTGIQTRELLCQAGNFLRCGKRER